MIDEARVPLVIAGSIEPDASLAPRLAGLVASLSPGVHFDTDEHGRDIELTDAGIEHVERVARVQRAPPRRAPRAPDRAELRAACARPPPPRRGLHRSRRPDRDRGRVHGPRRRGSSLARRLAVRAGSQGEPGAAPGRRDSGLDDAPAVSARLPPPLRHDRNRAGLRGRTAAALRARRRRHSNPPSDGAGRSTGRRVHAPRGEGSRDRGRDSPCARHRTARARRNRDGHGVGGAWPGGSAMRALPARC